MWCGLIRCLLRWPARWMKLGGWPAEQEESLNQQQRLNEYPALTSALMDYGWFIAPYINGAEHDRVKQLVAYIHANPPADDAAKQAIEDKIHHEFLDVAFSNQVRARYVWQALRTPHIREYSHLYESAVFAYYKREYAGAVCLLLTALEGVLLSINGWHVGSPQRKPSFSQLKNTIANLPLANINAEMNVVQSAFRDALSQFVSRWLYEDTSNADLTLSVLNRHYVLHGMNSATFIVRTTFTACYWLSICLSTLSQSSTARTALWWKLTWTNTKNDEFSTRTCVSVR